MSLSIITQFQYFILFVHLCLSTILGIVILSLSYLFISQLSDTEKLSSYECGFDPFGDARNPFNIHFYLVSLLFIVFDLEITFLFPWAVSFEHFGYFGYLTMVFFLSLLGLGFFYEWFKGALNWS